MTTLAQPERSFIARLFVSSAEPRLRAGWRLLAHFMIWLFFLVGCSMPLVVAALWTQGLTDSFMLFTSSLIGLFAYTLSIFLARRFLDRRSFASLGLTLNLAALRDLLFGIGLTGAMMGLIYLAEWALGWLSFEHFAWQTAAWPEVVSGMLVGLGMFILVGWNEELFSRGYQLQNLADGLNLKWGVIISSLIFALLHGANPNVSWVAIMGLLAAGFFLAYGYVRTRQLWLSIGLHIGWNFFEGTVFGFQVSGMDTFRLIQQTVRGPELVTGGAFGPEAGLIVLPALALGAMAIYFYTPANKFAATNTQSRPAPTGLKLH